MPKTATSFRLNPLHLKVLKSLTERMSQKNGTEYSQASVLEMAITRMWKDEVGTNVYEAFAIEDESPHTPRESTKEGERE